MSNPIFGQRLLIPWREWILGERLEIPAARHRVLRGAFASPRNRLLPDLGDVLHRDPWVLDWLFPADRYCADEMESPVVLRPEVLRLLQWRLDEPLRGHYVAFLRLMGATVDHHGWVSYASNVSGLPRWRLPELSDTQVTGVARVLRLLHLAGWRGYSYSNHDDRDGLWYDLGFYRWLEQRWREECGQRDLPEQWTAALDANMQRPREFSFRAADAAHWNLSPTS